MAIKFRDGENDGKQNQIFLNLNLDEFLELRVMNMVAGEVADCFGWKVVFERVRLPIESGYRS